MNTLSNNDENTVDIDETNAQKYLIETSMQKPVVVLFWSQNQQAGVGMGTILAGLASEYAGDFLYARVNVDTQSMIASQLGIQSLPSVMLIQQGQPVDAFQGDKNEQDVLTFLSNHLPKPYDKQLSQALEKIQQEDWTAACELLQSAYGSSDQRGDIALEFARSLLALHRIDQAETVLNQVKLADQNTLYEHLLSEVSLQRESAKTPEIEALEAKMVQSPEDLETKMQLAIQYHQVHMNKEACQLLIDILGVDREYADGKAKKTLLDIFKVIGFKDPLVIDFQRQLFSILY